MTTTALDPHETRQATTPAERLRQVAAAVRVSFVWMGVRKTLTPEQKTQAAESFGADGDSLTACKKLLDTTHPAFKAVTAVRGRAVSYWKSKTLPYPEPGIRLIRQDDIDTFNQEMATHRADLEVKVTTLDDHYSELKTAARRLLGHLHDPSDYPPSLRGLFALAWEFPNVQPPEYLLQLNPAIFEQEKARAISRFEEAVRLGEQAFISEFAELVSHLCERLSTDATGEKKVFRDTVVTNLGGFFDRFRHLNIHSSAQLDELVEQAQRLVRGVEPQALRTNDGLRQQIATQFSGVQARLDGMLVDRPSRTIIRSRRSEGGNS